MAWAHADWVTQGTPKLRADKLRQHIAEVSQKMGVDTSADGKSVSYFALRLYLDNLMTALRQEEARAGLAGGGRTNLATFRTQLEDGGVS
jgi:hypothetical protein